MIDAQYYRPIYFLVVFIYTLFLLSKLQSNSTKESNSKCLTLTIFLVIFIGFRPISLKYFVDMYGTALQFSLWARNSVGLYWDVENLLYDNIRINFATLGLSYRPFFILIALIYFVGIYYTCTRMFQNRKMIAFLVYLAAFSTFPFATNGIKAGAAAAVFLCALTLQHNKKYILAVIFSILSIGFHHSMILPVFAFIICNFYKNHKFYYYFWGFCFLVALLHITYFQNLFSEFVSDSSVDYLSGIGSHTKGFRIDFVLYSVIPIIIGWWVHKKKYYVSEEYKMLLNIYILINSIWMLCMYAEFTNRIAYLSWLIYPIVLIYPFINESILNQRITLIKRIVWGHLFFTLFMDFIYYA